jgi:hypothetical protein
VPDEPKAAEDKIAEEPSDKAARPDTEAEESDAKKQKTA